MMILKKLGGYIVAVVYNAVFVFKVLLHLELSGSQILVEQLVKHRQWQWDICDNLPKSSDILFSGKAFIIWFWKK